MLNVFWLIALLSCFEEFLLVSVNGQLEICRGCANDTKCHVFDPPTNSKYIGCYGEFDNADNSSNMQSLCADGFKVMNITEAVLEGFTGDMCATAVADEIFFFDESGYLNFLDNLLDCLSDDGALVNSFDGFVWGCGSTTSSFAGVCDTDGACIVDGEEITNVVCDQSDGVLIGPIVDYKISTIQLLDGSKGGVICIREPTTAPTDQPTFAPTQPTFNPSGVPSSTPTYQPTTDPTRAPTRMPTFTRFPTNQPSTIPSKMPSNIPSTIPSHFPSEDPSSAPTPAPSDPPTPTKPKKTDDSPINGVSGTIFNYSVAGGVVFFGTIIFCICFWGCRKNRKRNQKDESRLQMSNTNQHATINTTTPAQYETDMAQFSIGNIVKTKK